MWFAKRVLRPTDSTVTLLDRLLVRYPLVFRGWVGMDSRVPPLTGRIDCGAGWDALIEVLFEALEDGAQQRVRDGFSALQAPAPLQVKERHGQLRVDLYYPAPWTARLVDVAVQRSECLCADCGAEVWRAADACVIDVPRCALHARRRSALTRSRAHAAAWYIGTSGTKSQSRR